MKGGGGYQMKRVLIEGYKLGILFASMDTFKEQSMQSVKLPLVFYCLEVG